MAKRGRKPKKEKTNVNDTIKKEKRTEAGAEEPKKESLKAPEKEPIKTIIDFTIFEAAQALKVKDEAINLWIQHGHLELNERRNITAESLERWKERLNGV